MWRCLSCFLLWVLGVYGVLVWFGCCLRCFVGVTLVVLGYVRMVFGLICVKVLGIGFKRWLQLEKGGLVCVL